MDVYNDVCAFLDVFFFFFFFFLNLSFKIAMFGQAGVWWASGIVQGLPFG